MTKLHATAALAASYLTDALPATRHLGDSMTTTEPTITPEDFGEAHHGVHLFDNEYGDFYAYGHHDARRMAAAISAYYRKNDGYRGNTTLKHVSDALVNIWVRITAADAGGFQFEPCEQECVGAIPVTAVRW